MNRRVFFLIFIKIQTIQSKAGGGLVTQPSEIESMNFINPLLQNCIFRGWNGGGEEVR